MIDANNQVHRIVTDQLGSVRLVLSASGAVEQRLFYDPWGAISSETGTANFVPFGFAGGVRDLNSGFVRFGARDYDPWKGRWASKDRTRFAGGFNLYAYCENDPANLIDTTGRNPVVVAAGAEAFGAFVLFTATGLAIFDCITNDCRGVKDILSGGHLPGLPGRAGARRPPGTTTCHASDSDPPKKPWPGSDPTKAPEEGSAWVGPDAPGGDKGGWVKRYPDGTNESWHPDLGHGGEEGPHWDYNDRYGGRWRIFPDGTVKPK